MELKEAIEILKKLDDGYTFKACDVCSNYNETTLRCDKEKCEELIAIDTVIAELDRLQKEKDHNYSVPVIRENSKLRYELAHSVSCDKIRELISKIDVDIETNDRRAIMYEEEKGTSRYVCKLIAYDPRSVKNILQELLKEE